MDERFDVAVIGAGSGGLGAALAAARLGLSVLLVEKGDAVGGTATRGGVHGWEPGVGGTGLPFDIYRRLRRLPLAVGVYSFGRHGSWPKPGETAPFPGGEHVVDRARVYADTLVRHVPPDAVADEAYRREHWHGVIFEPDAYCRVVEEMLAETGRCTLVKQTAFTDVRAEDGRVRSLRLSDGSEVRARVYVDATGDGLVCLASGCKAMVGQESREVFGEPSAPERPNDRINSVSLIYRVTPTDRPGIEPLPVGVPAECWWAPRFPWAHMPRYPCGDLCVNMLPTMEGEEFLRRGYADAYEECRRRVLAHWHQVQTVFPEFRGYRRCWIAPLLGVRESRRIVGEYVLREQDLRAGLSGQEHEDIIAIADHAMDRHGAGAGCVEVPEPYGVPFRCLIPRGFTNLLVACRGASFSSLAASSCRLSRTMMQLGQAAGTAAALAKELGLDLPEVPAERLRACLCGQHVQLEYPAPPALMDHLLCEDAP